MYNVMKIESKRGIAMAVITIHAEDYLAQAVRGYAERMGKSVNLAVKDLLAGALGITKAPSKRHDMSRYCGILEKGEADEIKARISRFDCVDEELWK